MKDGVSPETYSEEENSISEQDKKTKSQELLYKALSSLGIPRDSIYPPEFTGPIDQAIRDGINVTSSMVKQALLDHQMHGEFHDFNKTFEKIVEEKNEVIDKTQKNIGILKIDIEKN